MMAPGCMLTIQDAMDTPLPDTPGLPAMPPSVSGAVLGAMAPAAALIEEGQGEEVIVEEPDQAQEYDEDEGDNDTEESGGNEEQEGGARDPMHAQGCCGSSVCFVRPAVLSIVGTHSASSRDIDLEACVGSCERVRKVFMLLCR